MRNIQSKFCVKQQPNMVAEKKQANSHCIKQQSEIFRMILKVILTVLEIQFSYIFSKSIIFMNKEEHAAFLQSIKQQQQRSRLVSQKIPQILERVSETLTGVRDTIEGIQETNKKIDTIKSDFNSVMEKLALKLSGSFSHPLKRAGQNDQRQKPSKISMAKAVEAMMDHEEILFVTGAGVSVGSGIPTFRGLNGLYTKNFVVNGVEMEPQQFITKLFFSQNPQPIWSWVDEFFQICSKARPSRTHSLIHDCLRALAKKGKKPVLVTQNIDNLHLKPENNEYEFHPIHGDLSVMRCSNLHYLPYQKQGAFKTCPQCGEPMRPHVMFFDESYGIPFGKGVKDRRFDFVVVIGSSLNTGLCIKLVSEALQIIEINPGPVIEVGNVHPFEETENALEEMLKEIIQFEGI